MGSQAGEINIAELLTKHKSQVVMGAVVVLSLFLAKYLYSQQIQQYDRLKGEITVEQDKSAALERIVLIDSRVKEIRKQGWDSSDFNTISSRIGEMAIDSGVRIQNVEPTDKDNQEYYIMIPFRIRAEGETKNLIQFIKKVETYPMLTKIRHLELLRRSEDNTAGSDRTLNADIQLEAYYFK
ncbi:MAG: type 4a pilus biogenesis protein PilO [Candidatus Omnitrophota bacterium]